MVWARFMIFSLLLSVPVGCRRRVHSFSVRQEITAAACRWRCLGDSGVIRRQASGGLRANEVLAARALHREVDDGFGVLGRDAVIGKLGLHPEAVQELAQLLLGFAQVRAEYRWVPGWLYRRKRKEVLAGFLARPAIYGTERFRARLEGRARENLRRAVSGA